MHVVGICLQFQHTVRTHSPKGQNSVVSSCKCCKCIIFACLIILLSSVVSCHWITIICNTGGDFKMPHPHYYLPLYIAVPKKLIFFSPNFGNAATFLFAISLVWEEKIIMNIEWQILFSVKWNRQLFLRQSCSGCLSTVSAALGGNLYWDFLQTIVC